MNKAKGLFLLAIISILIFGFGAANAQSLQESQPAILAEAVSTGITYQGYLGDANGPITDHCDFQFSVYGSESETDRVSVTQTQLNIWVKNGYFTVQDLDFGTGVFQGEKRYLEIAVRCPSGSGGYNALNPR